MKTITAKDFQLKHASIVKDVAEGHEYEVTFHRKPLIKLMPIVTKNSEAPERGSHAALVESLRYTLSVKGELYDLPYKELRNHMLNQKYGK
jgi:antitoxin (DNA-binding transcriptional repressor) of toxin-antitoxin stability system